MKSKIVLLSCILALLTSCNNNISTSVHGYKLVWSDEFNGESLNEDNWNYMYGDGTQYGNPGWGNNELQSYRKENVSVRNGNLIITVKREQYGGKEFTSARLNTSGKVTALYGRIEARIALPSGKGMWPAFWMLPENHKYGNWPSSGEIDIMEARGREPSMTSGALHYGPVTGSSVYQTTTNVFRDGSSITDYHIYAVEWDEDEIRWYADENNFLTVRANRWYTMHENGLDSDTAPFDVEFHILLNCAVGGNFDGGIRPDDNFQSAEMKVDYVRIYQ